MTLGLIAARQFCVLRNPALRNAHAAGFGARLFSRTAPASFQFATQWTAPHRKEENNEPENCAKPSVLDRLGLGAMGGLSAVGLTSGCALAEAAAATPAYPLPAAAVSVLQLAGPACFFFLQISGLKTVNQIRREKTTGDLSILPFLSLFTNCVIWTTYGALINDMTVMLPNVSGAIFGAWYTYNFVSNTSNSVAKEMGISSMIIAGTLAGAATMPAAEVAPYIGYTGCALAVFLMGSPLATMTTVLKEKSTRAMPFATSFATFLNAIAWTSYGVFVAGNPIIWAPNALGLAAASVQMSLFARFGIHKG